MLPYASRNMMLMKEDIALVLRTVKPPEKGVEGEGSNDRINGLRAAVDSPVSAQRPISIMMYLSAARVKDRAPRALRGGCLAQWYVRTRSPRNRTTHIIPARQMLA